jgi:hypothetical protein
METTKSNAPGWQARGAQENSHPDSEALAARDQHDKVIQTLRARAALRGFALHVISTGHTADSPAAFLVSRWNLSRTLATVGAVESFIDQAGLPHA